MYFLSSHVYLCEFESGAILLDLNSGKYIGIDAEHMDGLKARIGNWPNAEGNDPRGERPGGASSEELICDLLRRGILTDSATRSRIPVAEKCLNAIAIEHDSRIARQALIRHAVQFFSAILLVQIQRNELKTLSDWVSRRQLQIHESRNKRPMTALLEALAFFLRTRVWFYTAYRRCLFDSLVLSVYLTMTGVPCTLFIGVSTRPFLAHAWVQMGDAVLNDTAEHVQLFKVILAVGAGEY
jgi:hypothetical protein